MCFHWLAAPSSRSNPSAERCIRPRIALSHLSGQRFSCAMVIRLRCQHPFKQECDTTTPCMQLVLNPVVLVLLRLSKKNNKSWETRWVQCPSHAQTMLTHPLTDPGIPSVHWVVSSLCRDQLQWTWAQPSIIAHTVHCTQALWHLNIDIDVPCATLMLFTCAIYNLSSFILRILIHLYTIYILYLYIVYRCI